MNETEFSCIKQVVRTVHLTLPPHYISNEVAGVTELLESWKRQYVQQLHGVLVNYKNISLTSRSGFIHISKAYVHYDVTATFDLFCPSTGDIVKGKINRISPEHIGCLIQETINVTIHLPEYTSEFSNFIRLNREILFQITHFDFNRNAIRVNGQITPECVQLMEKLFLPVKEEEDESATISSSSLKNGMLDGDNMMDSAELESSFANYYFSNNVDILHKVKQEVESPAKSKFDSDKTESKHGKRKRESSTSDAPESGHKKKKKQKCGSPTSDVPEKHSKKESMINESFTSDSEENIPKKAKKQKSESYISDILENGKKEDKKIKSESSASDTIEVEHTKKKKKKHDASTSDIPGSEYKKKKKHKEKDSKNASKKSKEEKTSKLYKKTKKLVASGKVLKKDKKKSHKSKNSKSGKNSGKSPHKNKKGHKKKRSSKEYTKKEDSNLEKMSIKSEF